MSQHDEVAAAKEVAAALSRFGEAFPRQGENDTLAWRRSSDPKGRPVVILPGAGGTSSFFYLVADGLRAGGLDPVIVDYAGDRRPRALADAIERLARDLALSEPFALGCSYSAYWCQHLAADGPFSGLVLCNGFVEARDLLPNPLFDHAAIKTATDDELQGEWRERAEGQAGTRLGQLLIRAMNGELAASDLRGRLLEVSSSSPVKSDWTTAVMLVDCEDDPIVREEARKRFRETWPEARHVVIAGGGHYPYILAPDAFTAAIVSACHPA